MTETGIAVLVMAGGDGRRIGGAKPHRVLKGAALIEHALQSARGYGAPLAVGVRSPEAFKLYRVVECVIDADGARGPLASLAAGLRWAQGRGAAFLLTLPCDAPFLPRDLAARLLDCLVQSGSAAATPRSFGRLHPACSLWRTSVEDRLWSYAAGG